MSDAGSFRSNASGYCRYRTISRGSSIDESLFGDKNKSKKRKTPNRPGVKNDAAFVTAKDLERIRNNFSLRNDLKVNDQNGAKDKDEKAIERARARKEHMIALELNARNLQKKAGQKNLDAKIENIRRQAQQKIDQNEDIVKLLNTCSQRAAAFAIRDKQLEDKAMKEKQEKDYERLMDLSMEVDRLKEIARREEEEKKKTSKRIEDRKVIEDQIKERQQQRLLQEEARDQENKKMLDIIKKYKEQDAEKAQKRKDDAQKARLEVIRRNEEMVAEKEARKALDKKEDEMILARQAQQDEALRKKEEEDREAEREKRELQRKLLESQTKSMDKQAEIDELRARRASEEAERKHRKKELFEAQKRKRDMAVLLEARKQQEEEARLAKIKELEEKQEEYQCTLKQAADMAKRERDEAEMAKKNNAEFRRLLQKQIEENELKSRVHEQEKYEEGRKIKDNMAMELAKMEAIRKKMVADMKSKGVNEKYFGEMMSLDIKKVLMK